MHPCLRPLENDFGEIVAYEFWCPACAAIDARHGLHVFTVKDEDGDKDQEWSFDGEATFEPSLAYENEPYCHHQGREQDAANILSPAAQAAVVTRSGAARCLRPMMIAIER